MLSCGVSSIILSRVRNVTPLIFTTCLVIRPHMLRSIISKMENKELSVAPQARGSDPRREEEACAA